MDGARATWPVRPSRAPSPSSSLDARRHPEPPCGSPDRSRPASPAPRSPTRRRSRRPVTRTGHRHDHRSARRRQADVTVVKTAEQTSFTAGGELAYAVAISNAGPLSGTTATLTDVLPADVTFDADGRTHGAPPPPAPSRAPSPRSSPARPRPYGSPAPWTRRSRAPSSLHGVVHVRHQPRRPSCRAVTTRRAVRRRPGHQGGHRGCRRRGTAAEFTITISNQGPSTARRRVQRPRPRRPTLGAVTPTAPLMCTSFPCAVGDLLPGRDGERVVTFDVPPDAPTGR